MEARFTAGATVAGFIPGATHLIALKDVSLIGLDCMPVRLAIFFSF